MENQVNIGDQNTQQVGQNPVNQSIRDTEKPRIDFRVVGVVIFLCFLIFGIGGFYLGKKSTPKQSLEGQQVQLAPSLIPTADLSADWKTCTNTKAAFSIKYPENFEEDTSTCNYAVMDYNFVKDIDIVNAFDDFRKNWLLTIESEKYNQDINQWIQDKNLCSTNFESCSDQTSGPILNSIEFDQINRHYASTHVIVKINGSIVDFSLNARNPNTQVSSEIRSIYNQILFTFKFLNSPKNTVTVKLYYHDSKLDPNTDFCEANNYIEKDILKTNTPIKDAINNLIRSDIFEQDDRFILKGINLKQDGTLILEFPWIGGFTTGGSCRIGILTSQIEKTALQFSEVKKVTFEPEVFQP